jgi:signal transduction histidine kinase
MTDAAESPDRRRAPSPNDAESFLRLIVLPALVAIFAAVIAWYAVSNYLLGVAERNIQNVLLSHRGVHHYIQRVMHPAFYAERDAKRVTTEFYRPEILSSSFMVRVLHGFYNEERIKEGLPAIYYKMAADNPRNPVNKASALESSLIRMFNADRELKQYRTQVTIDGTRYLLYAMPFLETNKACLKCHGKREDAPIGLQQRYPGEGGFGDQVGNIRAVEVIRAPVSHELLTAWIVTSALVCGLAAMAGLVLFNRRLRSLVGARTRALEVEIAERRQAEEAVRELNRTLESRVEERTSQLAAANRELDAFAYSVSHDLRAPLRAVDGFSQALEEDCAGVLDAQGKDYLGRIRRGCGRMGRLIDDILSISRLSRCELSTRNVPLTALAEEIAEELRAGAPGRQVEFRIAPGLSAQGDPVLLRALLANLLGNAFKFTSRTEAPVIEFGPTEEDGKPAFFVRDNGAGFDMRFADKLFGVFQRLHSAEEFEGSGIGLATVARIVARHGGTIRAAGEVGRGATFTFTLPGGHS